MAASAQDRFSLINDNLAEILNPEIIQSILDEGKNPRIYWGMNAMFALERRKLLMKFVV